MRTYKMIVYDISNDRLRTKVAKYLEEKGFSRFQKSAFMGNVPTDVVEEIKNFWAGLDLEDQDHIFMISLQKEQILGAQMAGKPVSLTSLTDPPKTFFY